MRMRLLVVAGVLVFVIIGVLAWRQNVARVGAEGGSVGTAPDESNPMPPLAMEAPDATEIAVDWVVPPSWLKRITGGMRYATYIVPGAEAGADAECAVYYFGPGQGGGVDANLDRWSSEFEKLDRQDTRRREIGGMKVATIELTGTFAGHTMNPEDATGPRPKWGMLGAIVEGPNGSVFFKLAGPENTIASAKIPWEEMLSSLHTH